MRKRLGHVSDLQEMDNTLHETSSIDDMVMVFCNAFDENEHARIEGTAQQENQSKWIDFA